jgi:hypothetical protein
MLSSAQEGDQIMPVFVRGVPLKPKRKPRRQHFDNAVTRLRPFIAEARAAGHKRVKAIMNFLNEGGVKPPTGKVFTDGTMYRILVRLEELNLGPGPRSVSRAAEARPSRAGVGAEVKRAKYAPRTRPTSVDDRR